MLSARQSQYRFWFPKIFVPDEIKQKYIPFVTRIPGLLIKDPIEVLNSTVQSFNLPGPNYNPIEQTDHPGWVRY